MLFFFVIFQTCKRVQGFSGQDRLLQGQLADAELAGQWQVGQVAMATTNLLKDARRSMKQ